MEYLISGILGFILANLVIVMFTTSEETFFDGTFWGELKKQYKKHFALLIVLPILEGASLLFEEYTSEVQIFFFLLAFVFDAIVRSIMKKENLKGH